MFAVCALTTQQYSDEQCVLGTCWPTGKYYVLGVNAPGMETIPTSGLQGTGNEMDPFKQALQAPFGTPRQFYTEKGKEGTVNDPIPPVFNKVPVVTSLTVVLGGLGGIVSSLIAVCALLPMLCPIMRPPDPAEEQGLVQEPEETVELKEVQQIEVNSNPVKVEVRVTQVSPAYSPGHLSTADAVKVPGTIEVFTVEEH